VAPVVEFPDVFLPAEEYLDMFDDSESDQSGDLRRSDLMLLVEVS
jgi:hypothetical protein